MSIELKESDRPYAHGNVVGASSERAPMITGPKLHHGTTAWFEMVGTLLCEAALAAKLPPDLNFSLIERYTDSIALPNGLFEGLRFEIRGGTPSFRVGVFPDEQAEVTIEVTSATARTLNTLYSSDPDYSVVVKRHLDASELQVNGDLSPLGEWFAGVHDQIVDRTI